MQTNNLIEEKVEKIISKVRNLRIQKEYSQEYVGDRLGIGQVAYHKLENGKTKLKIGVLIKLALILEKEISYFIE
ncbi:helix-turn-helix domain-containing protein [Polaribacter sp.]|uniref:helix-turn-helix domain-containing protein n=1 Tax=Polaribacter sp. TaxID=1920175 RepID=UPI003F6A3D5F